MKLLLPDTKFRSDGVRLAVRPESLRGRTVGFLDGWGARAPDGSVDMYPLMLALKTLLTERFEVTRFVWQKKSNFAQRAPKAQLALLIGAADVVINGEAA